MQRIKSALVNKFWRCFRSSPGLQASRETAFDLTTRIQLDSSSRLNLIGKNVLVNTTINLRGTLLTLENAQLTNVRLEVDQAEVVCGLNLVADNASISVRNSKVAVGDNCRILGFDVDIQHCNRVTVGEYLMLRRHVHKEGFVKIYAGSVTAGANNRIEAIVKSRSGNVCLGSNNFLNHGTELRCDERITIGSNNLISYDCLVFDTNAHSTDSSVRRQEIMRGVPNETCQTEAAWPKTKQIIIGDDTWIGMRAAVLKGSVVGNSAVVGLCAVVTGHVPANHLAYGNPYSIKPLTP